MSADHGKVFLQELLRFLFFRHPLIREKEMNQLTNEDSSLNQLCVITSPKNIDAEYRFFIIDGKPVTASQYHLNNN